MDFFTWLEVRLENADGSLIPRESLAEKKTNKDGKSLLNPAAKVHRWDQYAVLSIPYGLK